MKSLLAKVIHKVMERLLSIHSALEADSLLKKFGSCGMNVSIRPGGVFASPERIFVGNDVYIGPGAVFYATDCRITIGSKVMFGPHVGIMAGDHNTSVIGKSMFDIKAKLPENDQAVVIEDDVWIGFRATILKGVTIGKGSIVGAGSVVTSSVPPYSIAVGVPAKVVRKRWTDEQIAEHELLISSETAERNMAPPGKWDVPHVVGNQLKGSA
jgi:acetyltransferase-like isoleucine patch superfamily enzyme